MKTLALPAHAVLLRGGATPVCESNGLRKNVDLLASADPAALAVLAAPSALPGAVDAIRRELCIPPSAEVDIDVGTLDRDGDNDDDSFIGDE